MLKGGKEKKNQNEKCYFTTDYKVFYTHQYFVSEVIMDYEKKIIKDEPAEHMRVNGQ
jgi:hypothetical protein